MTEEEKVTPASPKKPGSKVIVLVLAVCLVVVSYLAVAKIGVEYAGAAWFIRRSLADEMWEMLVSNRLNDQRIELQLNFNN